jgi:hypothetical protein
MVRFIFSVGRAEGQAGNGFSNQDYKVLRMSVNAGNNYAVFTQTLKDMVKNHWASFDEKISITSQSPSVINARRSTNDFDRILMPNSVRFSAESVEAGRTTERALANYTWAHSETGVIQGRYNGPQQDTLGDVWMNSLSGPNKEPMIELVNEYKAQGKRFWIERSRNENGDFVLTPKFYE